MHQGIQESPAVADKPVRCESMPKIAPIRRAYNVVADNTGLSSRDVTEPANIRNNIQHSYFTPYCPHKTQVITLSDCHLDLESSRQSP